MSLKIEGANSEVSSKIKSAEAKLLAKGKSKMPHAKEFKVKMRPNLVKASKGSFYGGHLYGTEDGSKWLKCAEVRIREGKEGAAPSSSPSPEPKPSKPVAAERPKVEETKNLKEALLHGVAKSLENLSYNFRNVKALSFKESRMHNSVCMRISLTADVKDNSHSRISAMGDWLDERSVVENTIRRSLALGRHLPGGRTSTRDFEMPKNPPKGKSFRLSFEIVIHDIKK